MKAEVVDIICIDGNNERREWLISAIASALRWYAYTPDKRKNDAEHAALLSDLIQELNSLEIK